MHGDMFASQQVNLADAAIAEMEAKGVIQRRLNVNGHETWGPLNKLAVHKKSGVAVDLFSVWPAENWWVSLVIRTGSLEMNLELTKGAIKLGRSLQAYGRRTANAKSLISVESLIVNRRNAERKHG